MAKDFSTMEASNASANPGFHSLSDPARRHWLRGGLGVAVSSLLGACAGVAPKSAAPLLGFKSVPLAGADSVTVPEGYVAQVIQPWGAPVGLPGRLPAFRFDGSNSAADQAAQMGMHHDGMGFFPLDGRSDRGLLVMNHEYADHGLLFPDGGKVWGPEQVAKSQAAHGFSVTEMARQSDGSWQPVLPSRFARRITASTPHAVGGPAAGHVLMRTAADPQGTRVLGTFANCAASRTPWGTYLAGEENFIGYFLGPNRPSAHQQRWGMRAGEQYGYRWFEHDERFITADHPNEPHRFGWVVEFDPYDPDSVPVKRTAMGRAAHEGATVAMTRDGRAVVYSGEDARFEYIYKFVSRDRVRPGGFKANATLLDHGTLYVARFDADGRGRWLPLVHGQGGLSAQNGFADQGEVVIKARQASDRLGATKMDRPEWIAVDREGHVYCTLTNNSQRGAPGRPGVDAANPRANNVGGHIIRWKEEGDFDGEGFAWSHFVLAGDPREPRAEAQGRMKGDGFACPDGLFADARGLLWIQTDMSSSEMGAGVAYMRREAGGGDIGPKEVARLGNNAMLAADPTTGEIRRFLVGPVGCEITGADMSPDGRTMFVNIQHPGETPGDISDPANPRLFSNWPDQRPDGRPRSATLAIRRLDGGLIGT
ncbi:MAG: PhoX family phosphatase [Burkholderiales bacterium]|nr:PhoX family phosphatase [Burkholderiales bacterium]